MPKTAIDYSKCCIYKIEHIDNESLVYVGHTTNFDKRKSGHKNACINEKGKKFNLKVYQMIRENGGWDMFKMIEVEKYSCNDKREAEKRENEIMKELKPKMNSNNSYITEEELKEHKKQYYEVIKEERKKNYETNKEAILLKKQRLQRKK